MKTFKTLLFTFFLLMSFNAAAQKTILHCGKLIDGKSDQVMTKMSVVIENNMIVSVDRGYTKGGRADKEIDLKDKTVMPGLMDMHVHIEGQTSPKGKAKN